MATLIRSGELTADYDGVGDVLYVSLGDPRPSESENKGRGVLFRFALDNEEPSGVTVIGFRKNHWDKDISNLVGVITTHLRADPGVAAHLIQVVTAK